jgi:hypothetical protein
MSIRGYCLECDRLVELRLVDWRWFPLPHKVNGKPCCGDKKGI